MSGVYEWVDEFQFSRAKKNIARDFSDAVLLAELLAQLFPAWVELHNYPVTHRFQQKLTNWETLNRKVLTRIKCEITRKQQEDLANAVPGAIELLLAQVRKQTAKNNHQKSNFKTPVSPNARLADSKSSSPSHLESGLKSLHSFKVDARTAIFNKQERAFAASLSSSASEQKPASPRSTRKMENAGSVSPKSLKTSRPAAQFSLADFLPTPQERPDQDDIASSFSKILQLMSKTEVDAGLRGGSLPSKTVKHKATTSPKRPLTPDHKVARQVKPVATRARPASADSKSRSWRQRGATVEKLAPQRILSTKRAKQACKAGPDSTATKQQELVTTPCATNTVAVHEAAKNEFAESSFVYFSCHEEPPVVDEQQAWSKNERVQVARFVRSFASGDCLVQLLKVDPTYSQDTTGAHGFKMYVSTPHFIECYGSQLHNIQRMKFDATVGKWKWFQQMTDEDTNGGGSSSLWKRDLAIDIAPNAYTLPVGPKTEPALKSRSLCPSAAAMEKKASQNSHFFTEVLSRVKCNSVSLEEPVIVCATEGREPDATPCPEFVQTLFAGMSFELPMAPTVFPKVQVDVSLSIPEKKPHISPTRRKSNASVLEVV